jgi:uncharacterized Zn finger protein (UPF0148 family)
MEPDPCPICFESITNKLTITCNHTFCSECIIKWFRHGNPQCPVCRDAPEMENSDSESDATDIEEEDNYQDNVNRIVNNFKDTLKTHPQYKELKDKMKECKLIRKDFKKAVKARVQKSIEIELNKIPKKKKVIFEEVQKIQTEIKNKCIINAKKIEQDSIPKPQMKHFIQNRLHRAIHGNCSIYWTETLNDRIDYPKELKITK